MDGGYYKGKWRTPAFMEYAIGLDDAFRYNDDWIIERVFARLESEAEISPEEYLELCDMFRPKK